MVSRKLSKIFQQTAFMGPAVLVYALVIFIPFLFGLYYSMTQWNGVSPKAIWVGLDNYIYIFTKDNDFALSFWFTTKITVVIVVLTNALGFLFAYLLIKPLKTRNLLRTIFFIPNVIGGLLLGFIWHFIFVQGFGAVGAITHLSFFNLPWLGTEATAFWGLVIVSVWQGTGYVMVIYIAGLVNVPTELKEASYMDGAKGWQVMRHITLPMIMPSITVCLFWSVNHTYKMYDLNYSLTDGGPFKSTESVAMNLFNEAFQFNRFGMGTAKAIVFFIVIALVTAVQVYITKKKEVEM